MLKSSTYTVGLLEDKYIFYIVNICQSSNIYKLPSVIIRSYPQTLYLVFLISTVLLWFYYHHAGYGIWFNRRSARDGILNVSVLDRKQNIFATCGCQIVIKWFWSHTHSCMWHSLLVASRLNELPVLPSIKTIVDIQSPACRCHVANVLRNLIHVSTRNQI